MLEANTFIFTLFQCALLFHNRGLFTEAGLISWLVLSIVILCDVRSCDAKIYPRNLSYFAVMKIAKFPVEICLI